MTYRSLISFTAKRALIGLAVIAMLTAAAFAQRVEPQKQGSMYGQPGFKGEPINLNVVNADIRDILSYITDQYGINFVIDKSVKEVPVTVKVNDVPWNVALDSVLQAQELGVQVNGNILRVADNKTLAMEGQILSQRLNSAVDASPLVTELIRLNYATAAGALGAGQTTSGRASGSTDSGAAFGGGVGTGAGGDGLMPIIKRRLSRRGSIEIDSRSNSLIITDVPSNLEAIKQLIAILDQPEPQVEIEARIVVASRNFSRDIGVQLAAFIAGPRASGGGGTLPGSSVSVPISPDTPNPPINNDLLSKIANTALGLTIGPIGTAQLNAVISAGEQKGQAKVIATPRVTALNNRPAEIKSGSKIPVTTIQAGASAGGAAIATTTYVDVPLRLAITPQITDQGTVILNVVAENSATATIVSGGNPAITTQSMTTQVTVPDGGTTVVGGVLFDDERESQDRTPGLSRIPIFGNLFKRKGVSRNTNEILFFITPRISRPDYTASAQAGTAPRSGPIPQPVPLGNPVSNSSRVSDVVVAVPGATVDKPEAAAPQKP